MVVVDLSKHRFLQENDFRKRLEIEIRMLDAAKQLLLRMPSDTSQAVLEGMKSVLVCEQRVQAYRQAIKYEK